MRRRDFSFTLALTASIVVHGWIFSKGIRIFLEENLAIRMDGWRMRPIEVTAKDEEKLGASDGTGDALDASPGETLLQARLSDQTQILGSLDPEGAGAIRDRPSMSVLPTGGSVTPPPADATPPQPVLGVPPSTILTAPDSFAGLKPKVPVAKTPSPETTKPADAPQTTPAPPAQSAVASIAGAPMPSADPAPQAETESDPVSVQGGAFFRNGKALVQFGRKHRLTAPRLTLAAKTDLMQLRGAVILVLKIRLDEAGNVVNVEIFKSSGSGDIDQTCRVEAYNWWLEPKRNKQGQPIPDEFLFTLRFS